MNSTFNDDITRWSRERICDFLRENGFEENFDDQEYEDLISIASAVKSSSIEERQHVMSAQEIITEETGDIVAVENIMAVENTSTISVPVEVYAEPSEEDQINLTLAMCEATGIEFEDAQKALKDVNWNLSTAIASFYDQSDIVKQQAIEEQRETERRSRSSSALARSRSTSNLGQVPGDENIGVMGTGIQADNDNPLGPPWSFIQQIHSRMRQEHDDEYSTYNRLESYGDDDDDDVRRLDEYDEDGIRRPDPVRQQRLISGRHPMNSTLGRADDPSVEWIYEPPRHLSFPGSFQEIKALCKEEKKWLLVNIQSHNEFSSHMLNRDTWTDETIESILRSSFMFWQRGHTSDEGRMFMSTYQMTEADLPNVSIIDSRTGARILTLKGFISPDDLSILLMEFLEANSVDGTDAPTVRHIDTTKWKNRDGTASESTSPIPVEEVSVIPEEEPAAKIELDFQYDDTENAETGESTGRESQPITRGFGAPPNEPNPNEDAIKISLKLPSGGKPLVHRFYRTDTVRQLYAFVDVVEGQGRSFDLLSSFPVTSLFDKMNQTLEEASLAGSQIIMRWL